MTAGRSGDSSGIWEKSPDGTHLITSTSDTRTEYAQAIAGDTLLAAARDLARHPDAPKLKVASGEHLAGILLSAFGGRIRALDADGGVDFVLEQNPDHLFGEAAAVVVEVKSAAGKWRQHLRHIKIGSRYSIQIEDHLDVLIDQSPRILRAAEQLASKTSEDDGHSREVFIAVHPLDRATAPALSDNPITWLTAPLPIPKQGLPIDGLWLLLFPMALARWSQRRQCWTRYVVAAKSPDIDEHVPDFIDAEREFLQELKTSFGTEHDVVWYDGLL